MRITVTTQDIEQGRRRDPGECPVARALRRAGISHFGVTGMLVIVESGRTHVPLVLPPNVQEWILDFDWGSAMAPVEFELTLPHEKLKHANHDRSEHPQSLSGRHASQSRAAPKPRRGSLRLPGLPRWSLPKTLLGRSLRGCQPRRQGRSQGAPKQPQKRTPLDTTSA